MRRLSTTTWIVAALLLGGALPLAVSAQTAGKGKPQAAAAARDESKQFDIRADDGIEWDKDRRTYTARGNVRIIRGNRVVRAPLVVAWYRDKEGNKTEVYKVDMDGGVVVGINDDTATGQTGYYDVDRKVFWLTGSNLVYNMQDGRVTAKESLEYYEDEKRAVARGKAWAVRDAEWIKGDVITAFFEERREKREPKPGEKAAGGKAASEKAADRPAATDAAATPGDDMVTKNKIVRIEATGDVAISSCEGLGRGDKLVYFPDTGQAIITGTSVRLTRGDMQMRGQRAEMNTRTQYMRLLPGPDGKQVGGTFFADSESFKPDNVPFEAGGIDPCKDRTKQTPAAAAGAVPPATPAAPAAPTAPARRPGR